MVIQYALAVALGSSVLSGCVVHAQPRVVVYDGHRPPVYHIEHYPRPMIHPSHHYAPHHFKQQGHGHHQGHGGHGHHGRG